MKAKKIQTADISDIMISSLPSRPTAPKSLGGMGYGATEMKEAFDRLPLYIADRYNELISDIKSLGDDSLAAAIPTGIRNGHTLHTLFEDIESGELAAYFSFLGKSLLSHIISIYAELDAINDKVNGYAQKKEETE